MAVALDLVPCAAGEVGHSHRSRAVFYGELGQRSQRAPFGQVVHVHVKRQSIAQAVNQTVVHDIVHAAMSAYRLGIFSYFFDDGMGVLCFERCLLFGIQEVVGVEVFMIGH